jgi:hypothetical protein
MISPSLTYERLEFFSNKSQKYFHKKPPKRNRSLISNDSVESALFSSQVQQIMNIHNFLSADSSPQKGRIMIKRRSPHKHFIKENYQ